MALFIVPPPWGCGWRIRATGARGRGPGLKRPSRRPSGPGKMTSGIAPADVECSRRRRLYKEAAQIRNLKGRKGFVGPRIYLDHASTTPILPVAADAIRAACDAWANPSSAHAEGRAVRAMMEEARRRIAAALGWDGALIFTSGATEAI